MGKGKRDRLPRVTVVFRQVDLTPVQAAALRRIYNQLLADAESEDVTIGPDNGAINHRLEGQRREQQ